MFVLVLAGCFPQLMSTALDSGLDSGTDSGDEPVDTSGGDGGCVQKGVEDDAESWDLPPGYPANTFPTTGDTDFATAPTWALLDLDGNGRSDIVVTRDDAAGIDGLGTTTWAWYSNTGSKFRVSSEAWALPSGYPEHTFDATYDLSSADPAWSLMDLTGDGLADLVITSDSASAVDDLGTSLWLVYKNNGTGFSTSPTSWALPAGYARGTFSAAYDNSGADPAWSLVDLNADRKPDFVLTHDDAAGVEGLGSTNWSLFANSGSGFASSGAAWELPTDFPALTFATAYDSSADSPTWGLLDLDGNGRTDLVVSRDDGSSVNGLGTSKWLYYSNTGARFREASSSWSFPEDYPTDTFATLSDTTDDGLNWGITDLDGDGDLDLAVTRNDDAGIPELGNVRWQLFTHGDEGFADTNTAWPLPEGFPEMTFGRSYDGGDPSVAWSLFDLDGDELLDLVVTHNEGGAASLGSTTWDRYPAHCK